MAWPNFVVTREVTSGPSYTLEDGTPLKTRLTVTASRSLVWDATGIPFTSEEHQVTSALGVQASLLLPVTDQAGWRDDQNNLIDVTAPDTFTHTYRIVRELLDEKNRVVKGSRRDYLGVVVPTGTGAIDVDLMLPTETVEGAKVAIPDTWSQDIAEAAELVSDAAGLVSAAQAAAGQAATSASEALEAVAPVASQVSAVAGDVTELETLTTTGRLGEAGLSATIAQATADKVTGAQASALIASAADPIRSSTLPSTGIAFITDSIGTFGGDGGTAWHWIMCSLSNGRLLHRGRFGTAGFTLTQIRDTHLPSALALSPKPGAIAICGGTNDVGGVGYNEATSRAVLLDIIERVKAAGIKAVLWTLPPRDDSTTVNRDVQRWNAWLRYFAATHGYPLIDSHAVFVNESTGLWQTALRQDEIHPGVYGHFVLGSTMAADTGFLARFPDMRPYLSASKGADPNMIAANARFFDAGVNGATSPNNWTGVSLGTNASGSEVADAAIPGNWFRFTKTTSSPSGQAIIRQQIAAGTTTFEPGDRVSIAVPFRVSSDPLGNVIGSVSLIFRTDTATISALVPVTIRGLGLSGIAYAEAVVPAGCTNIRLEIAVSGTPAAGTETFDVSRPTLLSLTKLGAA